MHSLSHRFVFGILAVVSSTLLAAGLILGELAHLEPCYLCNFQRLLYIVIALLSLCAGLLNRWPRFWSLLVVLTALWGVASACEQSWMQFVPEQVTECGFSEPTLVETIVNWLSLKWPAMFMVTGLCTVKDWTFLGLSLANWSALCFLALAGVAMWQTLRHR